MAKKRGLEQKPPAGTPRKDTPIDELDQEGSLMHYNAVMLEEMNSRLKLVLEFVTALSEQVQQLSERVEQLAEQMKAQFEQVNQRMDRLEQRMDLLEIAQQGLRNDMLDMEQRICSKINRLAEGHERRFAALESRP